MDITLYALGNKKNSVTLLQYLLFAVVLGPKYL